MISVKNLTKDFDDNGVVTKALRGVSFEIKPGEFVAVMGPSGSGKSTLLNILSFLERPSAGQFTFLGKSINDLTDVELARIRNKDMGYVFQSFNLLGRASVYENVEMPLIYSETVKAVDRHRLINEAILAVGLKERSAIEAGKLSGGEKQRVAIARALVNNPNVIFADEPTGNLDSVAGTQIMNILDSLHRSGRTVILVTHETVTSEYAHRLIKLRDGKIESDEPMHKTARNIHGVLK